MALRDASQNRKAAKMEANPEPFDAAHALRKRIGAKRARVLRLGEEIEQLEAQLAGLVS